MTPIVASAESGKVYVDLSLVSTSFHGEYLAERIKHYVRDELLPAVENLKDSYPRLVEDVVKKQALGYGMLRNEKGIGSFSDMCPFRTRQNHLRFGRPVDDMSEIADIVAGMSFEDFREAVAAFARAPLIVSIAMGKDVQVEEADEPAVRALKEEQLRKYPVLAALKEASIDPGCEVRELESVARAATAAGAA